MKTLITAGNFDRSPGGIEWQQRVSRGDIVPSGKPAWMSVRSDDGQLCVEVPKVGGQLSRVYVIGVLNPPSVEVFRLFGLELRSPTGTLDKKVVQGNIAVLASTSDDIVSLGDGITCENVGCVATQRGHRPVQLLSIDTSAVEDVSQARLTFGFGLDYSVFDIFFEFSSQVSCPFHSKSQGVSLAELGAVVRTGDRNRFDRAVKQLEQSLLRTGDLDEARGLALTFLAVIGAALLELGGPRSLHRFQLDAARKIDSISEIQRIAEFAAESANELVQERMPITDATLSTPILQALAHLNRNFAKDINDEDLARELGLSTSHFRFLFKQVTGEPFHRYLLGLRLEKAKTLIMDHRLPVAEAASLVGFTNPSHFSRAFQKRFNASPSKLR